MIQLKGFENLGRSIDDGKPEVSTYGRMPSDFHCAFATIYSSTKIYTYAAFMASCFKKFTNVIHVIIVMNLFGCDDANQSVSIESGDFSCWDQIVTNTRIPSEWRQAEYISMCCVKFQPFVSIQRRLMETSVVC